MAITRTTFASLHAGDQISDASDGPVRTVVTIDRPRRRLVNLTTYDDSLNRMVFEDDLEPAPRSSCTSNAAGSGLAATPPPALTPLAAGSGSYVRSAAQMSPDADLAPL